MTRRSSVGRHEVSAPCPNVLLVRFLGDLDPAEAGCLVECIAREPPGGWILVDLRDLGYIGPKARRELTGPRVAAHCDAPPLDLGFIGASMKTKVLMAALVSATSAVHGVRLRVHFFGSPEDVPATVFAPPPTAGR